MQPVVTQVATGPNITFVPVTRAPKRYERYLGKQSIGLGITAIVIGVLCCIFNGVALAYAYYYSVSGVGHGFWCGIFFIITGSFGISAGLNKRLCQIVAFMVLNILSATFTIALLTVGIIGATYEPRCREYYNYGYNYDYDCYYYGNCYNSPCRGMPNYKVAIAMESLLAISGFIEAIVAIWGAALCCKSGICCCSKPEAQVQVVPAGYLPNGAQVIYITQTQGGQYAYPPQPIMTHPHGIISAPPYTASYAQPGWAGQQPMTANMSASAPDHQPPAYVAPHLMGTADNQKPVEEKY